MADKSRNLPAASSPADVAAFIESVRTMPAVRTDERGRLIFAMDATASREPTWDRACRIQGRMFEATDRLGGLEIQLAYYRGMGEFEASPWCADAANLKRRMTSVFCLAGETQIAKVLRHAVAETKRRKVDALVFVGDCLEEDIDTLCKDAGELGLLGVPAFLFHEGDDAVARRGFKQIARLTNGAYCRFDANSPDALANLLRAVAVYAAGGRGALVELGRREGGAAADMAAQIARLPKS
ncbi:MAG TPA: VWA domain-containing protein [Alphaproteobacteria bacterium]|nr:VWA domain-containing protein [Alphaproteobacteria bacterium]